MLLTCVWHRGRDILPLPSFGGKTTWKINITFAGNKSNIKKEKSFAVWTQKCKTYEEVLRKKVTREDSKLRMVEVIDLFKKLVVIRFLGKLSFTKQIKKFQEKESFALRVVKVMLRTWRHGFLIFEIHSHPPPCSLFCIHEDLMFKIMPHTKDSFYVWLHTWMWLNLSHGFVKLPREKDKH